MTGEERSNEERIEKLAKWLDFQLGEPVGNQVRAIGRQLADTRAQLANAQEAAGFATMHWYLRFYEVCAQAEAAEARIEAVEGQNAKLLSALERTERNFRLAVAGKPVRDMCENLAENRAAVAALAAPAATPKPTEETQR